MEELFKPREKSPYASLPFITRPEQHETFISFVSESDGFEVFLHRNVQETIRNEAFAAAPNETIGLLAGRVVRDERGPYTLVLAAAGARPIEVEATPSHVRISANGHAQVRNRLENSAYGLDIIGWYHSHPRYPARFSSVDITEQSTWRDPNHIGIVISGVDEREPLGIYRGPNATLLIPKTTSSRSLVGANQVSHSTTLVSPIVADTNDVVVPDSTLSLESSEITTHGSKKMVAFIYLALGFGVLGMVVEILWLDQRLRRMEERLADSSFARKPVLTTPFPEPSPSPQSSVPLNIANQQDVFNKPEAGAKALSLQPQVKRTRRLKRKQKIEAGRKNTPSQNP